MNICFTIAKYLMAGGLLGLLCGGCSKEVWENDPLQTSNAETFSGTLISEATGRPLSGVRVRVLLVSGNKYDAPDFGLGTAQTNDKGTFTVLRLQPQLKIMPIELFKEGVIRTDTVMISFDGKEVPGVYRWFSGNTLDPVSIPVAPYTSDEISIPIVSER